MYLGALGIRSSYNLQVRTFKARLGGQFGYSDVNTHKGYWVREMIAMQSLKSVLFFNLCDLAYKIESKRIILNIILFGHLHSQN